MKDKIRQACLLAVLAIGLMVSAHAQTPEYQVHIPFEFHAGDKTLPAGDYVIAMVDFVESRNVLTIREAKNEKSQTIMFSPKSSKDPVETSELVFNNYDKQYFLAEIMTPTIYGEFSRTRAETRLAETQTSERVTVTMKK